MFQDFLTTTVFYKLFYYNEYIPYICWGLGIFGVYYFFIDCNVVDDCVGKTN